MWGIEYNELCMLLVEAVGVSKNKAAQILCFAIYHGFIYMENFSNRVLSKETILQRKRQNSSIPFMPFHYELNFDSELGQVPCSSSNQPICLESVSTLIPQKYEELVREKEQIVKAWLTRPSFLRTPRWRKEFLESWKTKLKSITISEKSIYRWVKAYQQYHQEGLIPRHHNAGRSKNANEVQIQCMEDARASYILPNGKLRKAYRKLEELCLERNVTLPKFW